VVRKFQSQRWTFEHDCGASEQAQLHSFILVILDQGNGPCGCKILRTVYKDSWYYARSHREIGQGSKETLGLKVSGTLLAQENMDDLVWLNRWSKTEWSMEWIRFAFDPRPSHKEIKVRHRPRNHERDCRSIAGPQIISRARLDEPWKCPLGERMRL
jgi:hypothetical protein